MKITAMTAWINVRTQRDTQVEGYLQEIHRSRPEDAKVVEKTFMQFAHELLELRAAAGGTARPTTTTTTGTTASTTTGTTASSSQDLLNEHLAMKQ